MKPTRSAFWRRVTNPSLGDRLVSRSPWYNRKSWIALWVRYFLFAWTTRRLMALGLIGMVPSVGLYMVGAEMGYEALGFGLAAVCLSAMGVGWVCRPSLAIEARMPMRVACGQTFTVRYRLTNEGRWPAHDVRVETCPFPGRSELRIKGPVVNPIRAGQTLAVAGEGVALRRGRYRLPPLRWDTDFPAGIWRWGRTDWSTRRLTVYPAYRSLTSLDLPLGVSNRLDVQPARELARSAIEFPGCRGDRIPGPPGSRIGAAGRGTRCVSFRQRRARVVL